MNLNDRVGNLEGRMSAIESAINQGREDRRQIIEKTESIEAKLDRRIIPLEQARWKQAGFIAALSALASFGAVIAAKLLKL